MANDSAQTHYHTSTNVVRASFGADRMRAILFYAAMTNFVKRVAPPRSDGPRTRLLDVGCGCGWSTSALAEEGYEATGIDLNPSAFEPTAAANLTLREGSVLDIPFTDASFDLVVTYQCIEHVPSPLKALEEMIRVCRPGGTICVIGPNLVTPILPLVYLCNPANWRSIPLVRRPGLPRHPYGNTLGEIIAAIGLRSWQLLGKVIRQEPRFTMREPDVTPPFHSDNDACYLCNPSDLISFFHARGLTILRRGKYGRLPLSYLLAGGTWVAARKPFTTA